MIYRDERVNPSLLEVTEKTTLITRDKILIVSLEGDSKINIHNQLTTLNKYDFLLFKEKEEKHLELSGNLLIVAWNSIGPLV